MVDVIKALNETTNSAGGFFVPEEFAKRVFDRVVTQSTALQLVEQVNMKYDVMHFPTVATGHTAYWVNENSAITSSDATFGQVNLSVKKVAALTEISTELMDDSDPSIMEYVTRMLSEDLAFEIDNQLYNGTGSPINGMRDTATYTSIQTIASTGANGDEITLAKISEAVAKLATENFTGSHLVAHPKVIRKLRDLKDTTNRPIFDEATFGSPLLAEGVIGTIYGLKVIQTNRLPTNLTKGTSTTLTDVLVVEAKRCGLFGNRRQLQFNKFYQIAKDNWQLQTNMRVAFTVPYQKSIVIIKEIETA